MATWGSRPGPRGVRPSLGNDGRERKRGLPTIMLATPFSNDLLTKDLGEWTTLGEFVD